MPKSYPVVRRAGTGASLVQSTVKALRSLGSQCNFALPQILPRPMLSSRLQNNLRACNLDHNVSGARSLFDNSTAPTSSTQDSARCARFQCCARQHSVHEGNVGKTFRERGTILDSSVRIARSFSEPQRHLARKLLLKTMIFVSVQPP
jgi:hypothetical protein